MNERIKNIALRCNAWNQVYDNKKFMVDKHFDIELFAELLINECVDTVNNAKFNGVRTTFDADLAGHVKEVVINDLKALMA